MMFDDHLPTMRFELAEWRAMPVVPEDDPYWRDEGHYRTTRRGRPIVFYVAQRGSGALSYAVRPVVRVKMGRRAVRNVSLSLGLIEAQVRHLEALRGRPLVSVNRRLA